MDKGFFSAGFMERWFHPAIQKFWSHGNIFNCGSVGSFENTVHMHYYFVLPTAVKSEQHGRNDKRQDPSLGVFTGKNEK